MRQSHFPNIHHVNTFFKCTLWIFFFHFTWLWVVQFIIKLHCFRQCLGAYSAASHCLNQLWLSSRIDTKTKHAKYNTIFSLWLYIVTSTISNYNIHHLDISCQDKMADTIYTESPNTALRLDCIPAWTYGSCRVSDQGTTLRTSDLHRARATILNPFNNSY